MQSDDTSNRRRFLQTAGAAWVAAACGAARAAKAPAAVDASREPVWPRGPLTEPAFQLLPTGSIHATGWLRRQLQIQADGLGGRLDETWADVGPDSGWLGGTGESWERGPYFLDGLLPLAWQLDLAPLKAKAQKFIDWTLDHPWPNGMFGPRGNDDWWPRMVMLKVLVQYHELTGDARVMPLMTRYFHHQLEALPGRPLRDWGRFRWQDQLYSVLWLYDRTGDPALLRLAAVLKRQGFDWQGLFADFPFHDKVDPAKLKAQAHGGDVFMEDAGLRVHGVNHAQGIKASPLWSLVSGSAADRDAVHHQLAMLDTWHGQPNGMFSADEHLAGRSPSQGTELCTVVETLFSLELALAVTGDAKLGDRIEQIAYNALPAAFTDDMWAHQYDQQANQVECSLHRRPWTTNGPEANLFGLEPHFGCCTANFHQGWPKLANSLYMASPDNGLVAAVYAPCRVQTRVQGVDVQLEQATDYPFRQHVAIAVRPATPVRFPLWLRIPGWARKVSLRVNGAEAGQGRAGTFARIDRTWQPGDTVELAFAAEPELVSGFHDALTARLGPLVFALPIDEAWVKWRQRGLSADWQVYPSSAWNVGLAADARPTRHENPISSVPFGKQKPAVTLTLPAWPVPAWKAEEGAADPPPTRSKAAAGTHPITLTLIPYAAAKLRITAFPQLEA